MTGISLKTGQKMDTIFNCNGQFAKNWCVHQIGQAHQFSVVDIAKGHTNAQKGMPAPRLSIPSWLDHEQKDYLLGNLGQFFPRLNHQDIYPKLHTLPCLGEYANCIPGHVCGGMYFCGRISYGTCTKPLKTLAIKYLRIPDQGCSWIPAHLSLLPNNSKTKQSRNCEAVHEWNYGPFSILGNNSKARVPHNFVDFSKIAETDKVSTIDTSGYGTNLVPITRCSGGTKSVLPECTKLAPRPRTGRGAKLATLPRTAGGAKLLHRNKLGQFANFTVLPYGVQNGGVKKDRQKQRTLLGPGKAKLYYAVIMLKRCLFGQVFPKQYHLLGSRILVHLLRGLDKDVHWHLLPTKQTRVSLPVFTHNPEARIMGKRSRIPTIPKLELWVKTSLYLLLWHSREFPYSIKASSIGNFKEVVQQ